jgi:chitosanase
MHLTLSLFVSALLASTISARDIPDNVQKFYDAHKTSCKKALGKPLKGFVYCGDEPGLIFLKGPGSDYNNMDIDCDGINASAGDCANDKSGQSQTAFQDDVRTFSKGALKDLDANKIPYVVFGNDGGFDPTKFKMQPLSVMAVVCGGQLVYGIWGDITGGPDTGESSISLAKLCFPDDEITGDSGHDEKDVLFIGFTGTDKNDPASYNWLVLLPFFFFF